MKGGKKTMKDLQSKSVEKDPKAKRVMSPTMDSSVMQTLITATCANLGIITWSWSTCYCGEIFAINVIIEFRHVVKGRSELGFVIDLSLRLRSLLSFDGPYSG